MRKDFSTLAAIRSWNYAGRKQNRVVWAGSVGKIQDGNAEQGGKIHLVISQAIMPWLRAGWVTLI